VPRPCCGVARCGAIGHWRPQGVLGRWSASPIHDPSCEELWKMGSRHRGGCVRGFENLSGQQRGNLIVESRASLQPLRWSVRCTVCGSSWNEPHSTLVQSVPPACRNSACGRVAESSRSSANVGVIPTGVRSTDSDSARRFAQEQTRRTVIQDTATLDQMMASADPGAWAAHFEYERQKKERQK